MCKPQPCWAAIKHCVQVEVLLCWTYNSLKADTSCNPVELKGSDKPEWCLIDDGVGVIILQEHHSRL